MWLVRVFLAMNQTACERWLKENLEWGKQDSYEPIASIIACVVYGLTGLSCRCSEMLIHLAFRRDLEYTRTTEVSFADFIV